MQARFQVDASAHILRNRHAVVHSVRGARRYQPNISDRTRGPCISLVDRVAIPVELERPVEVGTFFYRSFAIIFHLSAPEDDSAGFVRGLKLKPHVKGVHGTAWKEVSDLTGADDHVDTICLSGPDCRTHSIERSRQWRKLDVAGGGAAVCFFTDRERRRQRGTGQCLARCLDFTGKRYSEDIEAQDAVLKKLDHGIHLF